MKNITFFDAFQKNCSWILANNLNLTKLNFEQIQQKQFLKELLLEFKKKKL